MVRVSQRDVIGITPTVVSLANVGDDSSSVHGARTWLQPEATGSERCLPSEHEAQRRRDQCEQRESEEGARCAARRVRKQPHEVRPHKAAHVP